MIEVSAMTKPIPDKAEMALEYPDELYVGTFQNSSRFDAHLDETGVSLTLDRKGDADTRKPVHMHFHYALFAEILRDLAKTVNVMRPEDAVHKDALRTAAEALYRALGPEAKPGSAENRDWVDRGKDDLSELTPEEEVLLLHCLE
jgi:hypothetical protein